MIPHDLTTFDPRIADWLEDDPNTAPDQALDIVLAAFPSIKQWHASRLPRRFNMTTLPRLALGAAAIVIVVVLAGVFLVRPPSSGVGGGGPTPSPSTVAASVAPSAPPSPSASDSAGPIDTSSWTTYTSARYGFTIGHPTDWTEIPSSSPWTPAADTDSLSGAFESFTAPGRTIRASAWSEPVAHSTSLDSWFQAYCPKMTTPCAGLETDKSRPVSMDGHTGMLIQFAVDTQAFFLVGDRVYVVVVWESDADPRTTPYGGAVRLLKGYLSTAKLLPGGPASPTPSATPQPS